MNAKTFLPFLTLTLGAVFVAAACSGPQSEDNAAAATTDPSALTDDTNPAYQNPWGFDLPLPFFQLPSEEQRILRSAVPVDAVGAILTTNAPFRATATYLGKHQGEYFFAIADHVAIGSLPFAVELGYDATSSNKFTVPLDTTALVQSEPGDIAIYRASADLDSKSAARLDAIKPVAWSLTPLPLLLAAHPETRFVMIARGKYAAAECEIHGCNGSAPLPLWTDAAGKLWDQAADEANANQDATTGAGDILMAIHPHVLARGMTEALRDPDGLVLGTPGGSPFLQSSADWGPQSIAATHHGLGRSSGGPLFAVTSDGAFMVGSQWTTGVPEDLHPFLPQVKEDWTKAFGKVVATSIDGGAPVLLLEAKAPFAYASSVSFAAGDMRKAVTNEATGPDAPARAALDEFFRAGSGSGSR